MKKNLYIATLILSLTAVSCQKQELTPNEGADSELPVWGSSSRFGEGEGGSDSGDLDSESSDGNLEGDITDPNNDPDGENSPGSIGDITDPNNDPDGEINPGSKGGVVLPETGSGKKDLN